MPNLGCIGFEKLLATWKTIFLTARNVAPNLRSFSDDKSLTRMDIKDSFCQSPYYLCIFTAIMLFHAEIHTAKIRKFKKK